jgi:K+-transporting ATPase A subunit
VNIHSAIQYLFFVAVVTILVKPLGGYMERVFFGKEPCWIDYACRWSGSFIVLQRLILP